MIMQEHVTSPNKQESSARENRGKAKEMHAESVPLSPNPDVVRPLEKGDDISPMQHKNSTLHKARTQLAQSRGLPLS